MIAILFVFKSRTYIFLTYKTHDFKVSYEHKITKNKQVNTYIHCIHFQTYSLIMILQKTVT